MAAEHPIDPAVRARIEACLGDIESTHHVRVLYACESGSRGWGFASPDSDYDVRFIYTHPLPWYLQVSPQRDVIELPISDLLDINGWELRKALGLLKKGNATLIEWLHSPVVYRADAAFVQSLRAAADCTHRAERSFQHYVHMARNNDRNHLRGETVRLKKYLYVLRPLLAALWIERKHSSAPMQFQTLVDGLVTDPSVRSAIEQLLALKRTTPESGYGPPLPVLDAFIHTELPRLETAPATAPGDPDFSLLDQLLMHTVLHPHPTPAAPATLTPPP